MEQFTDKQQEVWDMWEKGAGNLSIRGIARELGIGATTVSHHIQLIKQKLMVEKIEGSDPNRFAPGSTTLIKNDDPNSDIALQWLRTPSEAKSKATIEQLAENFKAAVEDCMTLPKIVTPRSVAKHSMVVIPIGDPHIGMYAYHKQSGENFDCDIAEKELLGAVDYLVGVTPATEKAVILNLGDFFHGDTNKNLTTAGTYVHMDTRFFRVLQIGLAIMIRMIQRSLEKFKHVTVINVTGNHDEHTSMYLTIALMQAFDKNPRVEIREPNDFHYYEFHKVLIGSTHGNNTPPRNLPGIMAEDMPEAWARTLHRMWFVGHVHHTSKIKDEPTGATVESFRTLAPKDHWHWKKGYRAGRDLNAIVLHKEYGETDRYRCDILRARQ